MTKQKRLEVVKILVENGANVNVRGKLIGMTPLHWAAYNDDPHVVKYLLEECKAELHFNGNDISPVDMAGMCDNETICYIFAKWLEAQVAKEALLDVEKPNEDNEAEPSQEN